METGIDCPTPCDAPTRERSLKDRITSLEKTREELMMRVTMLEEHMRAMQNFTGIGVPPSTTANRNY
jgi:hypothetical protein